MTTLRWAFGKGRPGWVALPLMLAALACLLIGWKVAVIVICVGSTGYQFGWRHGASHGMEAMRRWQLEAFAEQLGVDETALAPDHPYRQELAEARAAVHAELERL